MITAEGIWPAQPAESGWFPHRSGCSQSPRLPISGDTAAGTSDQAISRLYALAIDGREWTSDGTDAEQADPQVWIKLWTVAS